MNTKGNQRYAETEDRLKEVLLELLKRKKFSEITVSEICEKAHIHRTTFYGHYEDVYDFMQKQAADTYVRFLDHFLTRMESGEPVGFLRLFEMVREEKEFYKVYLQDKEKINPISEIILGPLDEKYDKIIPAAGYKNKNELYYHQTFFCAGLSAIIQRWIAGDCAESPEEMCRILEKEYTPDKSFFESGVRAHGHSVQ